MEKLRRRRSPASPQEDLSDTGAIPAPPAPSGGAVHVIFGAMTQQLDLADMTVGEVRELLAAPYHIPPGAQALVDGEAVGPDHVLGTGETLEFARAAGEKGGARARSRGRAVPEP